ncbi:PerC family transcriptional regulator [Pantoea agglomerans]|jgi:hypothetical protein|uniref:PerC family transcriptional regulator n=1 Tax=Enterobacter agglomerans TaxID=549 RepID=UPI00045D0838|nr:PerC family transcriptional regulator [Pantoea agglomerans]KDA93354.1 hypothetical protein T296_16885 [Pantoea agglomerans Eh318]MDK4216346.1 PerC family transcriptional regulator [Pantoea agglomerans]WNK50271.1 PerC family transcriptional regulator [Pantoea agglomerans]
MINYELKVLKLITRRGPLKVCELCMLIGLHEIAMKRVIKPLLTRGILKRASDWRYSINSELVMEEGEQYRQRVQQATALEAKGFWLRAVQVWREAMLVARLDASRSEAKENCDRCAINGSRNNGSYSGIDTGRIPENTLREDRP